METVFRHDRATPRKQRTARDNRGESARWRRGIDDARSTGTAGVCMAAPAASRSISIPPTTPPMARSSSRSSTGTMTRGVTCPCWPSCPSMPKPSSTSARRSSARATCRRAAARGACCAGGSRACGGPFPRRAFSSASTAALPRPPSWTSWTPRRAAPRVRRRHGRKQPVGAVRGARDGRGTDADGGQWPDGARLY